MIAHLIHITNSEVIPIRCDGRSQCKHMPAPSRRTNTLRLGLDWMPRAVVALVAMARLAAADDLVDLHGFASQGYLKSDRDNYLGDSQRGSFDFNEFGLNASKSIGSNFHVGMQLFARDLGSLGNDRLDLDWAYGDYRLRDWLGIRVGRIRCQPSGLYNETRDIDLARVPVLLPQSVYPESYRDALSSYNGGSLYGRVDLSRAGDLDYQLFVGGDHLDDKSSVAQGFDDGGALRVSSIQVKYICGASAMWDTPVAGLRLGGTWTRLSYTVLGSTNALPPIIASKPFEYVAHRQDLMVASAQYSHGDLVISAEGIRISAPLDSPTPGLSAVKVNQLGWYVGAEYRLSKFLALSTYYSAFTADLSRLSSRNPNDYQRDLAVSARVDINDYWLVKLEGHWIRGTAQLLQQENLGPGFPFGSKLAETNWLLLAAKTTVSF